MNTIRKQLMLGLVAFSLAVTAAPGIARADRDRDEGFQSGHRDDRAIQEHRDAHEQFDHGRREQEHRDRENWKERERPYQRFGYAAPYAAPNCYMQPGYWAWNGHQNVWIPQQNVCE
jgi:hypothetical protein